MSEREEALNEVKYYYENPNMAAYHYYGENMIVLHESLVKRIISVLSNEEELHA